MQPPRPAGLRAALQALGPGILFAGAAIGGSHLVQSTRAGANYGFELIWVVVLVMLFKYPFFEFSHRFTAATGESLLAGYLRLGRWALAGFLAVAVVAAIINAAAVTLVTAGLAQFLFGGGLSITVMSVVVVVIVGVLLFIGRYPMLDRLMKVMVLVLGLCTITAVIAALRHGPVGDPAFRAEEVWNLAGITFLLALMGWMPAPIDVAVWPSLWALEKRRTTRVDLGMRGALLDFHVGYVSTGVLALAFVSLGALVMFGTGRHFSNSGLRFSTQLIDLYTQTLGTWSRYLISIVAFFTMFSTTITVFDGYTRTLAGSIDLLAGSDERRRRALHWTILPLLMIVAIAFIGLLISGIKTMMDVATVLAFLSAPIFAYLNYRVAVGEHMPPEHRPGRVLRGLSWLGFIYLGGFSLVWLFSKLGVLKALGLIDVG